MTRCIVGDKRCGIILNNAKEVDEKWERVPGNGLLRGKCR